MAVDPNRAATAGVASQLSRNTVQIFVLRAGGMGLLFLMHIMLARRLGPNGYGVVSYALSVASFGALLACLGLHNGILRFAAQYLDQERWGDLKGVLVRSFQIILVTSSTGAVLIAIISTTVAMNEATRQSFLYAAMVLPLAALGLWRINAARGLGGTSVAFVPEEVILPSAVILALLAFSLGQPGPAVWAYVAAAATATLLGIGWLLLSIPPQARKARAVTHTRFWLSVSLPMTVASVTQLSLTRADVLLIGALTTMDETGRYIAASRVALLASFTLRIVDAVVAPMISAAFHSGRRKELREVFLLGLGISILGCLPFFIIGVFMPQPLLRIFGDGYLEAAPVLRILLVGQFINAMTGPIAFLLLMTGYEKAYAKAIGAAALLSIIANLVVIPRWGIIGAACVTAATIAILNLAMFAFGVKNILPAAKATNAE